MVHFTLIASRSVTLATQNRLFFPTPKSFQVHELLVLRPQPALSSSEYTRSDPLALFHRLYFSEGSVLGCSSFASAWSWSPGRCRAAAEGSVSECRAGLVQTLLRLVLTAASQDGEGFF